jgi:hypothetical protein
MGLTWIFLNLTMATITGYVLSSCLEFHDECLVSVEHSYSIHLLCDLRRVHTVYAIVMGFTETASDYFITVS